MIGHNNAIQRLMESSILELALDLQPITLWLNLGNMPVKLNDTFFKAFFQFRYDSLNKSNPGKSNTELKEATFHSMKGRLMEILYLLSFINQYGRKNLIFQQEINISNTKIPIPVRLEDKDMYLWTQYKIPDTKSGLRAVPDMAITKIAEFPSPENIFSIIECKCIESMPASEIRKEFGKGFDLSVVNYTIINYYETSEKSKKGALNLGIKLVDFSSIVQEEMSVQSLLTNVSMQINSILEDKSFQVLLSNTSAAVTAKTLQ